MRKGSWDRHGANNSNCYKEMCSEKLFWRPKKTIYKRNQRFFAAVLTGQDESNVNTWEVQVFVEIIMRYVIKSTDKVLSLRKVYCAIDIS